MPSLPRAVVPPVADTVIGGLLLAYGLYEDFHGTGRIDAHHPLQIVVMALCAVPLLWRRRWPMPVFFIVITAFGLKALVMQPMSQPLAEPLAFSVALYTVAARYRLRTSLLLLAYAVALGEVRAIGTTGDGANQLVNNLFLLMVFGVGLLVRGLESRATTSESRVQVVEQWAEESSREAVQDERLRIARELHDIVAHDIGVVMLHAGGGRRMVDLDPEQAKAAFATIEQAAGDALAETRRLLNVLRAEHDPLTRPPTLDDVPALLQRLRDAGVGVDLDLDDVGTVSPGLGLCVYRIVQEASANAVRHGRAEHVAVSVSGRPDAVELRVTDDGSPALAASAGSGHGLVGMRERVAMFGGTLQVGPRPEGGFAVHACFPREAPA